MPEKINIQAKKTFLKELVANQRFNVREILWILDYLYKNEKKLANSHFVEKVEKTPRGLYLSVAEVEQVSLIYYKEGRAFYDPIQAFHDLRLNQNAELYLEIDFKDAWQSIEYLAVLEDNPYAPWNADVSEQMIEEMGAVLESFTLKRKRQQINQDINDALRQKNRREFYALSNKLKEIDQLIDELIARN